MTSMLVVCVAPMMALLTGSAQAASPPALYTGGVSAVTTSTAVLGGGVNPHGLPTSFYFQYGPTAAYGGQTALASAGSGTVQLSVSAPVGGLATYTTYHYRLVAISPAGTVAGGDRTFSTKKIPLTFKVSFPSPKRVIFGSPFSISGTLAGTGSANRAVVLEASPFPYESGFKPVGAAKLTDANGFFRLPVAGLLQSSQLRVAALETPPGQSSYSPAAVVRVEVRVTLHARTAGRAGFVQFYGVIQPAQSLALVNFELLRPGRKLEYLGNLIVRSKPHGVMRFSRVVHVRHAGLYRAAVQVSGGAQVSNHSRTLRIG